MLCFKFQQNRTINEEFKFWGVRGEGERERREGYLKFKNSEKKFFRMVVTLAKIESV